MKTFLVSLAVFIIIGVINITLTVGTAKAAQRVKNYIDNNDYQIRNYYVNKVEDLKVAKISKVIPH